MNLAHGSPSQRAVRRIALLISATALLMAPAALRAQGIVDSVQRAQERATLLHFCQELDRGAEHTMQSIRDRTDCWKRMQLEGMDDSVVDTGYRAAVADYDAAVASDSARQLGGSIDQKLATVGPSIMAHDLAGARRTVDGVLAMQPDNQRALAFRDRIIALARARQLRNTVYTIAVVILVLALALAGSASLLAVRHRRQLTRLRAAAQNQQAMLEIVDGIGRGKIYTLDGPIFRIGSALSDRPEEKNDLVLSDAGAFISRYHCAIVRKHGAFFLIDSSLNGTYMEDELLQRGEHRPLEDGDEFSLAGMARVKFLLV